MNLNRREQELLNIIGVGERIKTVDIVRRADMCRATVLKYLRRLKDSGLIDYEQIGPTKLWYIADKKKYRRRTIKSSEILELLRRFELTTGRKAVLIMAGPDSLSIYNGS
jgi:Mn-dependent DtxR family transcriptional regulator